MAMTLRLPEQLNDEVRQQAETENISMQALVVKATQEYVARHGVNVKIDEAMTKIKARYGDVLRRLGE